MAKDFQELIIKALEIKAKYAETERKKWGLGEQMQGMMTDVGELAELVMAHEGYKEIGKIQEKLEHELSDLLYAVIVIADKTGVDLEKSFYKTMDDLEARINNKQ